MDTPTMDAREAYKELGVDPSASDAEIKANWRRLVATWHPDRNAATGASRRMQQINKAYQHIRQLRNGSTCANGDGRGTETAAESATGPAGSDAEPRRTHFTQVELSLEDAILGCTRLMRGKLSYSCEACVGTGQRVLARACHICRGSGAVRKAALFGWMWTEEPCTDCSGDGRHRESCDVCAGSGEKTVSYRRRVRFPAGVRNGHILSAPAPRQSQHEIDLELEVKVEAHPLFTLDSDGLLRCEMPVNGYAWMSGRWVEVPTPSGMQQMRLNRNALTYRLSGQGFPTSLRGPRGDYFVKVVPAFPAEDDPAQEALIDKLITKSNKAAQADRTQPLSQWQKRLKLWNSQQKNSARDE